MNTKNSNVLQLNYATYLYSPVTIQRATSESIIVFFTFNVVGIYMNHLDMKIYMSTNDEGVGNDNEPYRWVKTRFTPLICSPENKTATCVAR